MFDMLFTKDVLLFTIPALFGTVVFLLKIALMAMAGLGGGLDVGGDVDAGVGGADVPDASDVPDVPDHGDSSAAFKMLSIHSIAAFLMGFGWGGLIGMVTLEWPLAISLGLGVAFGSALMWLLALMLKAVYDLQVSGNVSINDAVGRGGTVYTRIPGDRAGRGKVRVLIDDRARFFDAVTDGESLPSNTSVRVARVNDDNTLTVTGA